MAAQGWIKGEGGGFFQGNLGTDENLCATLFSDFE